MTNWIYYDTIYTERYLGLPTPDDNLVGYRRSDVTSKAGDMRGKKLMLLHGTAGQSNKFCEIGFPHIFKKHTKGFF